MAQPPMSCHQVFPGAVLPLIAILTMSGTGVELAAVSVFLTPRIGGLAVGQVSLHGLVMRVLRIQVQRLP